MDTFVLDRNEKTLQAVIGRMTACDGMPFRIFVTSHDLRRGLTAQGFGDLPNSADTVKQLIMKQGAVVRKERVGREIEGRTAIVSLTW